MRLRKRPILKCCVAVWLPRSLGRRCERHLVFGRSPNGKGKRDPFSLTVIYRLKERDDRFRNGKSAVLFLLPVRSQLSSLVVVREAAVPIRPPIDTLSMYDEEQNIYKRNKKEQTFSHSRHSDDTSSRKAQDANAETLLQVFQPCSTFRT